MSYHRERNEKQQRGDSIVRLLLYYSLEYFDAMRVCVFENKYFVR